MSDYLSPAHGLVAAATVVIVTTCVFMHYETLRYFTRPRENHAPYGRRHVVLVILSLLLLHIAEIWVFALGYKLLLLTPAAGELVGQSATHFLEYVYFSAVCYSTLGFGDIVPAGAIRMLVGTEAMTGLLLIAWSASYTYLQMEKYWRS